MNLPDDLELQLFADGDDPEQPDPESKEATPETEQPTEDEGGDSDDEKCPLTVDGKEVLVTYDELIKSAQKGYRFEQKMGDLKKTQAAVEEEKRIVAELQKKYGDIAELADFLGQESELFDLVKKRYQEAKAGKPTSAEADSAVAKGLKEIQERLEQRDQQEKLDKDLRALGKFVKEKTGESFDENAFEAELQEYWEKNGSGLSVKGVWYELHGDKLAANAGKRTIEAIKRARASVRAPTSPASRSGKPAFEGNIAKALKWSAGEAGIELDDDD